MAFHLVYAFCKKSIPFLHSLCELNNTPHIIFMSIFNGHKRVYM